MIKILKLIGFVFLGLVVLSMILKACGSSKTEDVGSATSDHVVKEPNKGTCNCEVKYLSDNTKNFYFNVVNFDKKNPDCIKYLKEWATLNTGPIQGIVAHFLDNQPKFTPPENGNFYDTDKIRKKVIMQSLMIGDQRTFYVDPLGYGVYQDN